MRRKILAVLALVATIGGAQLQAQAIVFDPANVAQAVLIAERTMKQWFTLLEQYRIIRAMNDRLQGGLGRYRTPGIAPSVHDRDRYPYGRPILDALNGGDPRGELYRQLVGALPVLLAPVIAQLPPAAQRLLRNQYAHLEISDSIAQRAIHQKAQIGGFSAGELERAIRVLESDTVDNRTAYHYFTAVLDKLTGSELIARRQETALNQELSHALELLILRTKQTRDTESAVMGLRLEALRGSAAGGSVVVGSALALQTWRQP